MVRARNVSKRRRRGFTLVEVLVVIVVLAVIAAIVLPKFVNSGLRSREAALKSNLRIVREAINLFQTDTGLFPASLDDLSATTAPPKGLTSSGALADIDPADWNGPYLESVPNDPISGEELIYKTAGVGVGRVISSASGTASDGTAYSSW